MNCPKCGHGWSTVIDCRTKGIEKRVRKECSECGNRFTIWEIFDNEYRKLKKKEQMVNKILSLMEVLKKIENEDN
jgi:transcriptional regulator NrdR family protein